MYVNTWLQSRDEAWPGTYPSGGPLPEVHDIWRAGAPDLDILAPDIHIEYFDDVCARYSRSGNPLFIPETSINPANALMAVGRYNTIGFSPFGVDTVRPVTAELTATYSILNPAIAADSGSSGIRFDNRRAHEQGRPPKEIKLGNYTLTLTYTGHNYQLTGSTQGRSGYLHAFWRSGIGHLPPLEAAAILIATGPDEYYLGGAGYRIDFTPNTPGPQNAGLGVVQEGKFMDGKWVVTRQFAGDDDGQGKSLR